MRVAEVFSACDDRGVCEVKLVQAEMVRTCSGVRLFWLPGECNSGCIAMEILFLKVNSAERCDG